MLMDTTYLQVDCQVDSAGEELSPDADGKKYILNENSDYQAPSCSLNDGKSCKWENIVSPANDVLNLSSKETCDDSLCERPAMNVEFERQQKSVDQPGINSNLKGCSLSSDFQLLGKEVENFSESEQASSSKLLDGNELVNPPLQESHNHLNLQCVDSCSTLIQSTLSNEVGMTREQHKDASSSPDADKREGSIIQDAVMDAGVNDDNAKAGNFNIVHRSHNCTLRDLSEIACRIEFEPNKELSQDESKATFSSNISVLPNNDVCNVNASGQGKEMDHLSTVEEDFAVAVWVKWRGKWQTAIRCPKVDCPLSTLKAKPTHERKSYVAVFFPRSRLFQWIDTLLIRPIEEFPEPLVNGDHRKWRKRVKDLTIARRFVMQKLAVVMLNFSDELHTEAVIHHARQAAVWKEFALEASGCNAYSDLGKLLVKLKNMILPKYICSLWLQNSYDSWADRCQHAENAESIEILTEELRQSVLWSEVDQLWNAPLQLDSVPEWKTWKQEAMKWFSLSHPVDNALSIEQKRSDGNSSAEQQTQRKRPKLEVRRAEAQVSPIGNSACSTPTQDNPACTVSPTLGLHINSDSATFQLHKAVTLSGSFKDMMNGVSPDFGSEKAYAVSDTGFCQSPVGLESALPFTPLQNAKLDLNSMKSYRKCIAFIEAKGRQCGRWASDGDIYCCVHVYLHTVDKSSREQRPLFADLPVCSGLTNLGRQCKHRAQSGSAFCKKHKFQIVQQPEESTSNFPNLFGSCTKTDNMALIAGNSLNSNNFNTGSGVAENVEPELQMKVHPGSFEQNKGEKILLEKTDVEDPVTNSISSMPICIGYYNQQIMECQDYAKRHGMYCEKHIPRFLKRARDGKSRLISKDVFLNVLRGCSSQKEKISLHQACEFLYKFLKNNLYQQHSVLATDYMEKILSQVSSDVGEFLMRLVSTEREKLMSVWGFGSEKSMQINGPETKEGPAMVHGATDYSCEIRCKICTQQFADDYSLGLHWTKAHSKEARWLFRGYACAVCMGSFTNRKVLKNHIQERHGVHFLQQPIIYICMSCNNHFNNPEELRQHVLTIHTEEFRLVKVSQVFPGQAVEQAQVISNKPFINHSSNKYIESKKFTCRFCGLKFDLLPDLGRHHQVAHMNTGSPGQLPMKRKKYHRVHHRSPDSENNYRHSGGTKRQSRFETPGLPFPMTTFELMESQTVTLGRLMETECSGIAESLFSKIQMSKPHPSNLDILTTARFACCRMSLHAKLEAKYGILPENYYLKAAKLCSEMDVQIEWHREGYVCPKGCKPPAYQLSSPPTPPPFGTSTRAQNFLASTGTDGRWEMEEYHYVLNSKQFGWSLKCNGVVLCEDMSFGKERAPIVCVVDYQLKDAFNTDPLGATSSPQDQIPMPWHNFIYSTKCLVEPSFVTCRKINLSRCACALARCSPQNGNHSPNIDQDSGKCENFDGPPTCGSPVNGGQTILQEGNMVYECNATCSCALSCKNRGLRSGVKVKLEVFRTVKGWAVRAAEPIPFGTFVCEYAGEVIKDDGDSMTQRGKDDGLPCVADINSHANKATFWIDGAATYMIDATKRGNVSRFINCSGSPNLMTYLVFGYDDVDSQLPQLGLFANRDIAVGEELSCACCSEVCDRGAPNRAAMSAETSK